MRAGAFVGVLLAVLAGASDVEARPKVMLFAPGGFVQRSPLGWAKQQLRDAGYQPLVVPYPTYDLGGADRYASRFAREHPGARMAVGFSAGGTLAANLAARGLVDRTVTVSGIGNLVRWNPEARDERYEPLGYPHWDEVGATMRERHRASPDRLFRERPLTRRDMLVIHSPRDTLVPFGQGERMAELAGARLRRMRGGHGSFEEAMPRILRYLGR